MEQKFKAQRELCFSTILKVIHQVMRIPVAFLGIFPGKEQGTEQKKATAQLTNELLTVYATVATIEKHGLPKSLIFINQAGMAIDLLNVEELNQEAAFNELLDNMKQVKNN